MKFKMSIIKVCNSVNNQNKQRAAVVCVWVYNFTTNGLVFDPPFTAVIFLALFGEARVISLYWFVYTGIVKRCSVAII